MTWKTRRSRYSNRCFASWMTGDWFPLWRKPWKAPQWIGMQCIPCYGRKGCVRLLQKRYICGRWSRREGALENWPRYRTNSAPTVRCPTSTRASALPGSAGLRSRGVISGVSDAVERAAALGAIPSPSLAAIASRSFPQQSRWAL